MKRFLIQLRRQSTKVSWETISKQILETRKDPCLLCYPYVIDNFITDLDGILCELDVTTKVSKDETTLTVDTVKRDRRSGELMFNSSIQTPTPSR